MALTHFEMRAFASRPLTRAVVPGGPEFRLLTEPFFADRVEASSPCQVHFDLGPIREASDGLAILLRLVEQGVLKPTINVEAPWTEVAAIARRLIDREFAGKAVLHLPG